jgi:cyclopropane fatty-acyl-phospholipid synthase-like methyltransferase
MIKQIMKNNKGITDIDGDVSLTHPGFCYHSGFDFGPEMLKERAYCKFVNNLLEDAKTVIDLGCGSAALALCFPNDVTYIGIDANPDAGGYTKEPNQSNSYYIVADVTRPFKLDPPVQADLLISIQFFEHIEKQHINFVIERTKDLVKVTGRLFLLIDNLENPAHLIRHERTWWTRKFKDVGLYPINNQRHLDLIREHRERQPKAWRVNEKHHMLFYLRRTR